MDYRGIITRGYHIDAGGQSAVKIITKGYIGVLVALAQIFNIVERIVYFQTIKIRDALSCIIQSNDARFTKTREKEVLF